jgi:hypothetical protein
VEGTYKRGQSLNIFVNGCVVERENFLDYSIASFCIPLHSIALGRSILSRTRLSCFFSATREMGGKCVPNAVLVDEDVRLK